MKAAPAANFWRVYSGERLVTVYEWYRQKNKAVVLKPVDWVGTKPRKLVHYLSE